MAQVNMALDLSHMAEPACIEAVESYAGPVIASHSNPRRFHPTDRGLSDDMIGRLVARDGVVGIVPYNEFLKSGWKTGDPKELVSIQIVVDAIDHVSQIAGGSANVGIGSDFDGGFGAQSIPAEMDTIADLLLIAEALDGRGYAQEDVERIMSGNWLRILSRIYP
jgi:membrane dipeptidase